MRRFRCRGVRLRAVAAVVAGLSTAACQPVDVVPESAETAEQVTEQPLDAPVRGMPTTLAELIARAAPEARAWQDEPVLAEVLVAVGPGGAWERAELTFIAADADRQLAVRVTAEEISEELTTLSALQLRPMSEGAVAQIPPLPPDAREPAQLAGDARAVLRECRVGGTPQAVLYASGAPATWNGRRWAVPPQWTATVTTSRGAVQLDPVTGQAAGCVEGGA